MFQRRFVWPPKWFRARDREVWIAVLLRPMGSLGRSRAQPASAAQTASRTRGQGCCGPIAPTSPMTMRTSPDRTGELNEWSEMQRPRHPFAEAAFICSVSGTTFPIPSRIQAPDKSPNQKPPSGANLPQGWRPRPQTEVACHKCGKRRRQGVCEQRKSRASCFECAGCSRVRAELNQTWFPW